MTLTIHTTACPLAHTSDGECIGCKETFTITPRVVPTMTEAEPSPPPQPRSCNRHEDCFKAEAEAATRGVRERYGPGTARIDHCHDDDCEDCFGR